MFSHTVRHCFYALGFFSVVLGAQTPSIDVSAARPPGSPASSAPARRSPEVEAALAGIKFEAPVTEKKKPEPAEDVDLRDSDRPRNAIIRLPKYIVEGQRPPVFTEKEINTKKGLAELAVNRYLSTIHQALNPGAFNDSLAMEMYHDDERMAAKKDYAEKVSLFRAAGDKDADALKKDADAAFSRRGDFTEAADKK